MNKDYELKNCPENDSNVIITSRDFLNIGWNVCNSQIKYGNSFGPPR